MKFKKRFEGKIRYINKETGLLGALMGNNLTSHPTLVNSTKISFGLPNRETIDVHENKKQKKTKKTSNLSSEDSENKMYLNNLHTLENEVEQKKKLPKIKLPKLNTGRCLSVPDENAHDKND